VAVVRVCVYVCVCVVFTPYQCACVRACVRCSRALVYDLSFDRATIVQLIAQCSHGDIRGIVERCESAFFYRSCASDQLISERVIDREF
jgi:hypothetical protein